jgi:hypothetical protein
MYSRQVSGNDIEQNSRYLQTNARITALIKTNRAKLKQLRIGLLKHLKKFIIVNRVIISIALPKSLL